MEVTEFGMVTEESLAHLKKAFSLMDVIELGKIIEVSSEQSQNAPLLMEVTELPIVTEVSPEQPLEDVTADGNDRIWNGYRSQSGAEIKCGIANGSN